MGTLIEELYIYAVAKRTAFLVCVLPPLMLVCLWLWYQWRFRRVLAVAKKHATGLPTIPILGHAYMFMFYGTSDITRMLIKAAKDTIARGINSMCLWVGPHPLLFFFGPNDIRTIVTSSKAVRDNHLIELFLGKGVFTAIGDIHKTKRTYMSPMFGLKNLKHLMPVFNESSKDLTDKLSHFVGKGPIDIKPFVRNVTLRNAACITFGPEIKFETYSEDMDNLYKVVSGMSFTYVHRNYKFWLRSESLLNLLWKSIIDEINKYWKIFSDRPLKELKKLHLKDEQNIDILNSSDNEDGNQKPIALPSVYAELTRKYPAIKDIDLHYEMKSIIFGGAGSPRESISFMLLSLAALPKIQEKVYKEIMSVVGPERDVTLNDIERMTYLDQVFKETLRKYTVLAFFTRRLIEDLQLSTCIVPAGATIGVCLLALHHNPEVFPDPEKFDPDRFSPENLAKIERWHFLPFGYGPNNCIGLQYAALTVKTAVVQVLRKYRVSTTMDINNIKFTYKVVITSDDGFNIELNDRA